MIWQQKTAPHTNADSDISPVGTGNDTEQGLSWCWGQSKCLTPSEPKHVPNFTLNPQISAPTHQGSTLRFTHHPPDNTYVLFYLLTRFKVS